LDNKIKLKLYYLTNLTNNKQQNNKTMNTDLYLIKQYLERIIPDDISNKIFLLLLGMVKTPCANCINVRNKMAFDRGGLQYEIRPQQTRTQQLIMCEIRIAQFDGNVGKKRTTGAIRNIKQYMKTLDQHFKQRVRFC